MVHPCGWCAHDPRYARAVRLNELYTPAGDALTTLATLGPFASLFRSQACFDWQFIVRFARFARFAALRALSSAQARSKRAASTQQARSKHAASFFEIFGFDQFASHFLPIWTILGVKNSKFSKIDFFLNSPRDLVAKTVLNFNFWDFWFLTNFWVIWPSLTNLDDFRGKKMKF